VAVSDIPYLGPVGAVRVGLLNGSFIINPTYEEMKESLLNIVVVGTSEGIVMIESGAKEVKEETVVDAIEVAHAEIKKICATIRNLADLVGVTKRHVADVEFDDNYYAELKAKIGVEMADALDTKKYPKAESYERVRQIKQRLKEALPEGDDEAAAKLSRYFEVLRERLFREAVTKQRKRPDSRE